MAVSLFTNWSDMASTGQNQMTSCSGTVFSLAAAAGAAAVIGTATPALARTAPTL
jgi:hypothetical protein